MKVTPELLKQYHLGQCTDEERAVVEAWLEEDEISIPAQLPALSPSDAERSKAQMWQHVREQMETEEAPVAEQRMMRRRRWLPYAAAILLLPLLTIVAVRYGGRPSKDKLAIMQTQVSSGERKIVTLSDGSKVYLNAGASLRYPQAFRGETREVTLLGEGYFEVTGDKKKPFIINTAYSTQVKVVGTAFNVRAEPYSPNVEVAVAEGTVHFMKGSDLEHFMELNAGQSAVYDSMSDSFIEGRTALTDIGAWKENRLIFNREPLKTVFAKIEKWYGYKVTVARRELLDQVYHARYDAPQLDELLRGMAFVLDFRYKINDKEKTVQVY